jgi:hypothetical protein
VVHDMLRVSPSMRREINDAARLNVYGTFSHCEVGLRIDENGDMSVNDELLQGEKDLQDYIRLADLKEIPLTMRLEATLDVYVYNRQGELSHNIWVNVAADENGYDLEIG